MDKFNGITDAELTTEIERRRKEAAEKARKARREKNDGIMAVLKRTDLLAHLQHSRTSCSDTDLSNGWSYTKGGARCTKCAIMEFMHDEYVPDEAEIELMVNVRYVGELNNGSLV